jgi:hypothetical protein
MEASGQMRFVTFRATEYDEVFSVYQPGKMVERWKNQRFEDHLCPRPQGTCLTSWFFSPLNHLTRPIARENFIIGEWSASHPGRFTPKERDPGTHWIGGWVGPRASLDVMSKRKITSSRQESKPDRPARSQSLYQPSYPGSLIWTSACNMVKWESTMYTRMYPKVSGLSR